MPSKNPMIMKDKLCVASNFERCMDLKPKILSVAISPSISVNEIEFKL